MHYYWESHRLPALSDEVVEAFVARVEAITSLFSQVAGWAVGGAVSRADADASAVGERERKVGFEVNVTAGWPPRDQEDEAVDWVREGWALLRPHAAGVHANFLSDEDAPGIEEAYCDRLERLRALKDRYDPTNVFRLHANIRPSRDVTDR